MTRSGFSRFIPSVLVFLFLITLWELYSRNNPAGSLYFPSPGSVMNAAVANYDVLLFHSLQTIWETVIGLAVAVVLGLGLSIILTYSRILRTAIYPLIIISQTFPLIALAPLLLIFFGFGILPKIIMVVLFCFFPIVISTTDALTKADQNLIKLMVSMDASRFQIMKTVRLPSALPAFFSGLRVAATYSMTGAIAGEFVASDRGLGLFMKMSANSHAFSLVYASIAVTVIISIFLFVFVSFLEKIFVPWK